MRQLLRVLVVVVVVVAACSSDSRATVSLAQAELGKWYYLPSSVEGQTLSQEVGGMGQVFLAPNVPTHSSPGTGSIAVQLVGSSEGRAWGVACLTPQAQAAMQNRWQVVDHPGKGYIHVSQWTLVDDLAKCRSVKPLGAADPGVHF